MNPILQSRIRHLIGRRKNFLFEREDLSSCERVALLRGINHELLSVLDRSLILMGANPQKKKTRSYRVKKMVMTGKKEAASESGAPHDEQ